MGSHLKINVIILTLKKFFFN